MDVLDVVTERGRRAQIRIGERQRVEILNAKGKSRHRYGKDWLVPNLIRLAKLLLVCSLLMLMLIGWVAHRYDALHWIIAAASLMSASYSAWVLAIVLAENREKDLQNKSFDL